MTFNYAQIDAAGVCYALSELAAPVVDASLIPVAAMDKSLLGQVWNGAAFVPPAP